MSLHSESLPVLLALTWIFFRWDLGGRSQTLTSIHVFVVHDSMCPVPRNDNPVPSQHCKWPSGGLKELMQFPKGLTWKVQSLRRRLRTKSQFWLQSHLREVKNARSQPQQKGWGTSVSQTGTIAWGLTMGVEGGMGRGRQRWKNWDHPHGITIKMIIKKF